MVLSLLIGFEQNFLESVRLALTVDDRHQPTFDHAREKVCSVCVRGVRGTGREPSMAEYATGLKPQSWSRMRSWDGSHATGRMLDGRRTLEQFVD